MFIFQKFVWLLELSTYLKNFGCDLDDFEKLEITT